jgi:hypothetical protein
MLGFVLAASPPHRLAVCLKQFGAAFCAEDWVSEPVFDWREKALILLIRNRAKM